MALQDRRIDALLCDKTTAPEKIKAVTDQLKTNSSLAQKAIEDCFKAAHEALTNRQKDLEEQVVAMTSLKTEALTKQLDTIRDGTCPPAPPPNPLDKPDPDLFLMCKDGILNFKNTLKELEETVGKFGYLDEASTYASESKVRGPAVDETLKVEIPGWFDIYACDLWGNQRTEGGEMPTVTLSNLEDFEMDVKDMEDGRYRVSLKASVVGRYCVNVAFGGEELRGSAFNLEVLPTKDYTKIGEEVVDEKDPGRPWLSVDDGHLMRPAGISFDPAGKFVFVADQSNDRIQVFDADTKELKCCFGTKGRKEFELNTPGYIIVDRDYQVIITDILNHRLQIFSFNPRTAVLQHVRVVGEKGKGQGQFLFPRGIKKSENGRLYVCDSGNNRVQVLDTRNDYAFVQFIGEEGEGDGQFQLPLDVAISRTDEILVADSGHRIQVFDQQGVFLRSFGKRGHRNSYFKHITAISVDDENAVFVCDQGNHRVQIFNAADGSFIHKWGGGPKKPPAEGEEGAEGGGEEGGEGEEQIDQNKWIGLSTPSGITLNAYGKVLVSDYDRHCVYAY